MPSTEPVAVSCVDHGKQVHQHHEGSALHAGKGGKPRSALLTIVK